VSIRIVGACLLLAVCLCSCYVKAEEAILADLAGSPRSAAGPGDRMVLFILTDGLKPELLYGMMERGELPNFSRYLYDRGAVSDSAFTAAPSVTYALLTACVTGRYGAHSGVTAMKYIDRETLTFRQYDRYVDVWSVNEDCKVPTLMEVLEDQYTFVNFWPIHRGADHYARMFYNSLRAHVFGLWGMHDAACCDNVARIFEYCSTVNRYPRFSILYIIGTDFYGHLYGPETEDYRDYVKFIDAELGKMFHRLDKIGVLDKLLLIHLSDHGMMTVNPDDGFDLLQAMRRDLGMRVTDGDFGNYELEWSERLDRFNYNNAVVTISGNRYAYIYLSSELPNRFRSVNLFAKPVSLRRIRNYEVSSGVKVDLVKALLKYDAVEHVLARKGEGAVAVYHRDGEAEIERKTINGKKLYRYRVVSGSDPFAYTHTEKAGALVGEGFHSAREWLAATAGTEFPDAVVQCIEVFDSKERVGDVIVYPSAGHELVSENKGAHGGLHRCEMRIPMVFAGPGIRRCRFGPVRIVDLFPTILDYLGYSDRLGALEGLDGESFLGRIATGSG